MCRIIILEPKKRPKHTLLPESPASIPQKVVTPEPTEKKADKTNNDTKETNAQLPKISDVVDQPLSKSAGEAKRSGSKVARNNQEKSKDGKSGQLHQHPVPNAIRRVSVIPSPARSRLPKHVRFAMPISDQNNKEINSADSTSSDDSSVDDPPRLTKRILPRPLKRTPTRSAKQIPPRSTKQAQPRPTKQIPPNMYSDNTRTASSGGSSGAAKARPPRSPWMVGNSPSRESDISSNADVGKMSGRMFSPSGMRETFQLPESPIKRISPLSPKFRDWHDSVQDLPNPISHNLGNSLSNVETKTSPRSGSDLTWDSNSDQESAIDPNEHDVEAQAMDSDMDASGWEQNLRSHIDDRFNDWLTRLEHSTPLSTSPSNVHQPLFKFEHRDNRTLRKEHDQFFNIEKELVSDQTHLETYNSINTKSAPISGVKRQNRVNGTVQPNGLWNYKSKQARMPPSHKVSSFVDVEDPVYYDPALGMYWRDV